MQIGRPRTAVAVAFILMLFGGATLLWGKLPWSPMSAGKAATAIEKRYPNSGKAACSTKNTARFGRASFGRRFYTCAWVTSPAKTIGVEVDHSRIVKLYP